MSNLIHPIIISLQSHSSRYYMRYLSAVSLPGSLGKRQQYHCGEGEGATPLAAVGGRQGDTVHSKAAFERWKERQQDKLEKCVCLTSSFNYSMYVLLQTKAHRGGCDTVFHWLHKRGVNYSVLLCI